MDRGQESMPIQLLLGVTILTFVLVIGFYSYRQVCATQYDQKVKAGLNKLARTMEQAYQGGVGTSPPAITIDTSVPAGCEVGFDSVRVVRGPSDACIQNTGKDSCVMIVVVATGKTGGKYISSRVFVDIPESTTVSMEGTGDCGSKELDDIFESGSSSDFNDYCGWRTGTFSVKVTKKESDKIVIKKL